MTSAAAIKRFAFYRKSRDSVSHEIQMDGINQTSRCTSVTTLKSVNTLGYILH